MNKRVRAMAILCVSVILVFTVLSGCSQSANQTEALQKEGERQTKNGSDQEKVVVDFWSIWDSSSSTGKMIYEAAEAFNASHPNIEVVVSGQGGYNGVAEKLEVALVAKQTPVIAQIEESFIARYHPIAADLSEYLSQETIDNYIDGLLRSSYVDGVFKAAPMNRSTPILYLNVDLLQEAGLPKEGPKTWDELYEFSKKIADPEKGIYGFTSYWDVDAWHWESALYSYGGEIVNEDGTKVAFDNEAGWKIVDLWQRMIDENIMFNPYGSQENKSDIMAVKFLEGKVGMLFNSIGNMGQLLHNNTNNINIQTAYQPAGTEYSVVTGGANMIILDSATEAQKKAAGKFIEYLASDEFSIKFFKNSGYFPTTESSVETEEMQQLFEEYPQYKVAIDQLQYAHKRPWQKNWRAMYMAIVEELELALIDTSQDPKEVIHRAATKAQQIIDENQ